jgi:cation transport ATPase
MKKALFAAGVLMASGGAFATQTIKAQVNGMVCAFCAQGIEMKMGKQAATKEVFVDLKKKVVAVELKDGQQMSLEKFKADIKDAGYDVVKAEYVDQPVAAIKAEFGAK